MTETALVDHLPTPGPDGTVSDDAVFDAFSAHTAEVGLEMYPAQEEAIFELLVGNHVIVNTPTGSGKSLVATAAHFAALATGRRSWYTAPIKALVSEKFFALCREFGSERVGMITGDASVNADAPIVCCTQEILANLALRHGPSAEIDVAIVDEFHYYGDPQRGWAWQVPLLELPHVQFVLMSATLGDVGFLQRDLTARTGRETSVVRSSQRPVPLGFEYRTSTLHHSVEELLAAGRAPIYLVHFTQKDATDAAQGYLALDPLTKADKTRVKEVIGGFRFDSPIGKDLKRFLSAGVGVHHAGLLPKYRLLVEKLAQDGLLKIICGTDTLGVGVNVPIRSVLFTQLFKYDGTSTRVLTNREFAQIAGRAGRKGFDDSGDVWVQAPEHVVENLRLQEKADAGGRKKVVKKKAPDRNFAHWDRNVFDKVVEGRPEELRSHFHVNHQMVMSVLDRAVALDADGERVDGCRALKRLLTDNHETRARRRGHIRRAIAIYRSLVDAGILEFLDEPDELGRTVRVTVDLQDEFALHQPLSLWALEAILQLQEQRDAAEAADGTAPPTIAPLDADATTRDGADAPVTDPGAAGPEAASADDDRHAAVAAPAPAPRNDVAHALDVLTVIEAVQENPGVVIAAQVAEAKDELMAEMKAAGVEYEERMERLAQVEAPKPNRDWIYSSFNEFRSRHPWVGGDTVRPKSVARDLHERSMTFGEYVSHHSLKRSEGVVLRYLSDVYKGLVQNVAEEFRTEEIDDLTHWLGALVRQVDSSLIDEWESLVSPDPGTDAAPVRPAPPPSVVDDARAFRVMVRNQIFEWATRLARRRDYSALVADPVDPERFATIEDVAAAMAPYWERHDEIGLGPDARSPERFAFDASTMRASQILHDPEETNEWRVEAVVDVEASIERGAAVLRLADIIGDGDDGPSPPD
ncbi:DEAD/DEAH box helicase [Ilumatobacter sp.]|uniref:DEAD/DEAH box helicase n=1 Tax=Ilumatobacter sp. TaxID=1967498 RepID=UPI003B522E54